MYGDNRYDENVPIYLQIMDRMKRRILTGDWQPGDRIPAVRDLAMAYGVNPNTMQRALSELEREGLLFSERTTGRFITRSSELIEEVRGRLAEAVIREFIARMEQMGFTRGQIAARVAEEAAGPPPGPPADRE